MYEFQVKRGKLHHSQIVLWLLGSNTNLVNEFDLIFQNKPMLTANLIHMHSFQVAPIITLKLQSRLFCVM